MIAKDIFRDFKEHRASEFFRRNAAMLGYTGKIRSLTTIIHEGVTNAIDAAEETGVLPSIFVMIKSVNKDQDHYKVIIEDNASGIPEEYVPRVFGKMLAGTKLHRNVQNRGQQGIGISGSTMFAQVTSGNPTKVVTSTKNGVIVSEEIMIDVDKNRGKVTNKETTEGDWRGTRIEFDVKDVAYQRSRYGPFNYIRMTAIANPHVRITFGEPDGSLTIFERATEEIPDKPKQIPLHPAGIKADTLLDLAENTRSRTVETFLVNELSRFSKVKLKELRKLTDVNLKENPSKLSWEKAESIVSAFRKMDFMSPSSSGLRPIGKEDIERGLQQILNPEFVFAITRPPKVYREGIPFIVEAGVAYGGNAGTSSNSGKKMELIRFANRAPLIFDQGGCAITLATKDIDWHRYNVVADKAPLTLFVNIVSTHVPYTSAGKQSVAEEPEIYDEIRWAIMKAARKLRSFLHRKRRSRELKERAGIFEQYIPIIAQRAGNIAGRKVPDTKPLLKKIAGAGNEEEN